MRSRGQVIDHDAILLFAMSLHKVSDSATPMSQISMAAIAILS